VWVMGEQGNWNVWGANLGGVLLYISSIYLLPISPPLLFSSGLQALM
jgi:hypothetical protein